MANTKISALTSASIPLTGTEVLPIVQSGATVKVAVSDLTAGRAVSATQYTSTIATGTAPLVIASTTNVANLNASSLNGATFAAPGAIGSGTASTGAFTTISASTTVTSGALTANQMTFAGTAGVLSGVDDILYTAASAGLSSQLTLGKAQASTNVQMAMNGVVNKATRIRFQESGVDKWLVGNGAASEAGPFEVFDATNGTGVQLNKNANAWSALSDERLKDIIEPITGSLDKVATLRTVIGKYKKDKDGTRRSFLIAQDVLAVLPEAVDVAEDEMGTLSLRTTDIVPLLVAALNELNGKFNAYVASHP